MFIRKNKPEEFKSKFQIEKIKSDDAWKFNLSVGFAVVAMGLSLTLWGSSNYCAKYPNCNLDALFFSSTFIGFFLMVLGTIPVVTGAIQFLHKRYILK